MPLHPQCKAFLDMIAASGGPPLESLPVEEARKVPYQMIELGGPVDPVAHVGDWTIPGPVQPIRTRVYRPASAQDLPALVFFHGGGFVICDLETHDRLCRKLANASGSVVVAIDYRLAPEHKFPAALDDAYAATRYVAEHPVELGINPARLAVGGDSAGGTLAAAVALMARDRGAPSIRFQLMIYPLTDWDDDSPSIHEYGENYFLTRDLMKWFATQFVETAADRRQPYASPLRAADLRGLPPGMIITAECDPLRDQGEAYGRKLQDAGVPVVIKRYDGMIHPFLSICGVVDAGREAIDEAASAVRQALKETASAGV
jgi:acetyl esterase